MTGRIMDAGYCTFGEILSGAVSARRYFEMQDMADWKDHVAAKRK